jgi:hypothetical protein
MGGGGSGGVGGGMSCMRNRDCPPRDRCVNGMCVSGRGGRPDGGA